MTTCAGCGQTGGKFKFCGTDEKGEGIYRHQDPKCLPGFVGTSGVSTFPFTTTNFDGHPTTVNSMRHLRQLENAHGVHSAVYTNDGNTDR